MRTAGVFALAAVLEIAGCYAVWMWWRLDRSILWLVPGGFALLAFAFLLAQADSAFAGRAYAAYGGVYVAASLVWMRTVEGVSPDAFDAAGAAIVLFGSAVILFGRRVI